MGEGEGEGEGVCFCQEKDKAQYRGWGQTLPRSAKNPHQPEVWLEVNYQTKGAGCNAVPLINLNMNTGNYSFYTCVSTML